VSTDISSAASALTSTTADASSQSSRTLEQSELSLSLSQYRADLGDGQSANALRALANQITTDARALGQAIAIPNPTGEDNTTPTATTPVAASSKSSLDTLV